MRVDVTRTDRNEVSRERRSCESWQRGKSRKAAKRKRRQWVRIGARVDVSARAVVAAHADHVFIRQIGQSQRCSGRDARETLIDAWRSVPGRGIFFFFLSAWRLVPKTFFSHSKTSRSKPLLLPLVLEGGRGRGERERAGGPTRLLGNLTW